MRRIYPLFFVLFSIVSIDTVIAYPTNTWSHIESDHFIVSYNDHTKDRAWDIINIAEEYSEKIGDYFGKNVIDEKISIVLYDHNDYSNGSADFNTALIKIYCRKTEKFWRSEKQWLKQVLSHELAHLYSLRILKSRFFIHYNFELINSKDNYNGSLSSYHTKNILPVWFVEGLAQIGSHNVKADYVDPLRKMLLRDAFLNNRLLSLEEMGRFEGSSREYELAYNQGYNLLLYLMSRYPHKSIKELCSHVQKYGLEYGFSEYYGRTIEEVYDDWKDSLSDQFKMYVNAFNGKPIYNYKKGILINEIAAVQSGRYVITNWNHDYNRFDLFEVSGQDDTECIAKDVGTVLKEDRKTGNIYFNKKIYNYETGVANLEICRLNSEGEISQITEGMRSMAFDIDGGTLLYAKYEKGITSIMSYTPGKPQKQIKVFDNKTAVYNISIISEKNSIVTIGRNGHVRPVLLNGDTMTELWQGIEWDVLDTVYTSSERIVFSSTLDGTPQIYWCMLNEPNRWYRITNVSGGAMKPMIETVNGKKILLCSIYYNGSYRIYSIDDPFTVEYPFNIADRLIKIRNGEGEKLKTYDAFDRFSNIVYGMPDFFLFYRYTVSEDSNGKVDNKSQITSRVQCIWKTAPGNHLLGVYGDLFIPIGYKSTTELLPSLEIWYQAHWGKARFKQEYYHYYSLSETEGAEYYYLFKRENSQLKSSIYYQLNEYSFLGISYKYRWFKSLTTYTHKDTKNTYHFNNDPELMYRANIFSVYWENDYSISKFDPAEVGVPYRTFKLGVQGIINDYPGYEFNEDDEFGQRYVGMNSTIYKTWFLVEHRWMFLNNSSSFKLKIDGFSYFRNQKDDRISLFMYDYIGRENYFSGYDYGSISVTKMLHATGEIRLNPFVNIFDRMHWYERVNLGIRIESGTCHYFSSGTKSAEPLSVDGTLRFSFYIRPSRPSSIYIKYAKALKNIEGSGENPDYRIYFGISI